ncbi:MAG: hypothetical protein COA44_09495 [Arcobacter sp.]|nr:MAG: hypothetical protein COA44_09495 [Arcobacter sp.]
MVEADSNLIKHLEAFILSFENEYSKKQLHTFHSNEKNSCPTYNGIFDILHAFKSLNLEEVKAAAKRMAKYNLESTRPYVITINSIQSLSQKIMKTLLQDPSTKMASKFYEMNNTAESCIAQTYLNNELKNFTKFNKLRLESIKRLNDINTLYLYEAHLLWFDKLTLSLSLMDMNELPELDHHKCIVGKWILSEGREVITDETIFNEFINLHENLHLLAIQIQQSFEQRPINFHLLVLLLNKAELFSLSIGVELSIINNIRFQATASKDPLTGTLNRQLLFHIFSTQFELSRAIEKSFCLIMMDLDNFKRINDIHGHIAGDNVLKAFSNMLLTNLRESDFAIRYGGEEFLLILPSANLKQALILAEKLRTQSHLLQEKDALVEHVTASFGVLDISPKAEQTPNELLMAQYIQKVDEELYLAKKRGKDQVSSKNNN